MTEGGRVGMHFESLAQLVVSNASRSRQVRPEIEGRHLAPGRLQKSDTSGGIVEQVDMRERPMGIFVEQHPGNRKVSNDAGLIQSPVFHGERKRNLVRV